MPSSDNTGLEYPDEYSLPEPPPSYDEETIWKAVNAMLSLPTIRRFMTERYLECDDENILQVIEECGDFGEDDTTKERVRSDVETYTCLKITGIIEAKEDAKETR